MVNMEEQIEKEVVYVQSNMTYLIDCCKKYGIKNDEDYKELKKIYKNIR